MLETLKVTTELGIKSGTIVTKGEDERIKITDGRTIEVVPMWRFLLDLPEA